MEKLSRFPDPVDLIAVSQRRALNSAAVCIRVRAWILEQTTIQLAGAILNLNALSNAREVEITHYDLFSFCVDAEERTFLATATMTPMTTSPQEQMMSLVPIDMVVDHVRPLLAARSAKYKIKGIRTHALNCACAPGDDGCVASLRVAW